MFGSCFRRLAVILVSDRLICYSFIETFDQDKDLAMRVHVGRGGGSGVKAVRGWGVDAKTWLCLWMWEREGGRGVRAVCGRGVGDEVRDLELNRPVAKVSAR